MAVTIVQIEEEDEHKWAVAHGKCDLENEEDELLKTTVAMVREAYGEEDVVSIAESLIDEADPSVGLTFDLTALRSAVRHGMPNPVVEAGKPCALANYRSEACEMLAKWALRLAFNIDFPVPPQAGKTNANMPVLGFDHWGLAANGGGDHSLVLVQVKGTEADSSPPDVCDALCKECARVSGQTSELCRALTILVKSLNDHPAQVPFLRMLESLGKGILPSLMVAPAVVRGGSRLSAMDDLSSLRSAVDGFAPAFARGVSFSIGVSLADFGEQVMKKARSA